MSDKKSEFLKKAQQLIHKKSAMEKPIKKLQASVGPFSYHNTSEGGSPVKRSPISTGPLVSPTSNTWRTDLESSASSAFAKTAPYVAYSEPEPVRVSGNERNFTSQITLSPDLTSGSLLFGDHENRHQLFSTPIPKKYTCSHSITDDVPYQSNELIMKCSELESRLKKQTEVNKELKRLLVASIGGNLQSSLNRMVQEKAVISHDLDISLERLAENHEEIDRISIECDIWRSKYLASRVMIDELAGWKAEISQQLRESQRALRCILKEHAEISKSMFQSSHYLNEIGVSLKLNEENKDSEVVWTTSDHQEKSILELAKVMLCKTMLLGKKIGLVENNNDTSAEIVTTTGERLAKQVLMCDQQPSRLRLNEELFHKDRMYSRTSHSKFHFLGTESSLPFHCNNCRGRIHNV